MCSRVRNILATPLSLDGACGKLNSSLVPAASFSFLFFFLFSLIFMPDDLIFQISYLIYFFFIFDPCSFYYYLFYLK